MAECYSKSGERLIIPAVREAYIQPFDAPNWLDLRVGFFLSVTGATDDDDPDEAGMEETLSDADGLGSEDRYWIGVKTEGDALPRASGVVFIGYTNTMHAQITADNGRENLGNTKLIAADDSTGAGATHWLPSNTYATNGINWTTAVTDGRAFRAGTNMLGTQQHFARDTATIAAGYATLHAIKLTRPNVQSRQITMTIKRTTVDPYNTDILFSNTPTEAIIESNLQTFPTGTVSVGPIQVSRVPEALYFYWPFRESRLRVHSIGLLKYR